MCVALANIEMFVWDGERSKAHVLSIDKTVSIVTWKDGDEEKIEEERGQENIGVKKREVWREWSLQEKVELSLIIRSHTGPNSKLLETKPCRKMKQILIESDLYE